MVRMKLVEREETGTGLVSGGIVEGDLIPLDNDVVADAADATDPAGAPLKARLSGSFDGVVTTDEDGFAVVVVPAGFSDDLQAGKRAPVQVIVDGTEANTGQVASQYAANILRALTDIRLLKESVAKLGGGTLGAALSRAWGLRRDGRARRGSRR